MSDHADTIRRAFRVNISSAELSEVNAALDALLADTDGLRMQLDAEKHVHLKDNEHLLAERQQVEEQIEAEQWLTEQECRLRKLAEKQRQQAIDALREIASLNEPGNYSIDRAEAVEIATDALAALAQLGEKP